MTWTPYHLRDEQRMRRKNRLVSLVMAISLIVVAALLALLAVRYEAWLTKFDRETSAPIKVDR